MGEDLPGNGLKIYLNFPCSRKISFLAVNSIKKLFQAGFWLMDFYVLLTLLNGKPANHYVNNKF